MKIFSDTFKFLLLFSAVFAVCFVIAGMITVDDRTSAEPSDIPIYYSLPLYAIDV